MPSYTYTTSGPRQSAKTPPKTSSSSSSTKKSSSSSTKTSSSSSSTKKSSTSTSSSSVKKPAAPKKEKEPPRYPKQLPGREGLVPRFDCVYKWKFEGYKHDQVFPYGSACMQCAKHGNHSPHYYTKHGGGPPGT